MPAHHLIVGLLALTAVATLAAGCQGDRSQVQHLQVAGGDPGRGEALIQVVGCGACHTIPGISQAHGTVGPPLTFWSRRSFIAGNLPNSPSNLVRWIRDPRSIEPGTAMPTLGLTEPQARDVAAYLYTLD